MHSNLQTQPFAINHNPYLAKEFGIIPVSKNVKDEALTSASTDFQALITCFFRKKENLSTKCLQRLQDSARICILMIRNQGNIVSGQNLLVTVLQLC